MRCAISNPDLFFRQVARCYPLTAEQIDQYSDDLDFGIISENEHVEWDGVIIGSNGVGDYLILLLKNDSAYELGSRLYLLEHELGQIVPSVDLDSIHK